MSVVSSQLLASRCSGQNHCGFKDASERGCYAGIDSDEDLEAAVQSCPVDCIHCKPQAFKILYEKHPRICLLHRSEQNQDVASYVHCAVIPAFQPDRCIGSHEVVTKAEKEQPCKWYMMRLSRRRTVHVCDMQARVTYYVFMYDYHAYPGGLPILPSSIGQLSGRCQA